MEVTSMFELNQRLAVLEERFAELGYNSKRLVESSIKRSFKIEAQSQTLYAPIVATCVSTLDPLNLNRVRIFHPLICNSDTKIKGLPFARANSSLGGFDDCGASWVPPAGSAVVVVFENGDRASPIYLGTVWNKNRGPQGNKFSYPVDEFYALWREENYRGLGYLVGATDGSQVYPPWASESGNHNDFDNEKDIDKDPDAQKKITYPYIYGIKTPGKHMIKMVDGDHRCNDRWSRFEIMSKRGNWIMMKDDWMHTAGEWAGLGGGGGGDNSPECSQVSALLQLETAGTQQDPNTDDYVGVDSASGDSGTLPGCGDINTSMFKNPYFRRMEENRPYLGAQTPMRNRCELKQSGLQIQCISGHQVVMDDSVNQPQPDKVKWYKEFDFGCDNIFKGKFYFRSATGHYICMDDSEDIEEVRGKENGIKFITAAGNYFKMRDHTYAGDIAAEDRGIEFGSTGGHVFEMNDNGNEQASPKRRDGGVPKRKCKQAYVQLRSGYGLLLRMDDSTSQEETRNQYIMLMAAPKKTSSCVQPHTLLMQLEEGGGGFIELASGGRFVLTSKDNSIEAVGTPDCIANKFTEVSGNYLVEAKQVMFTKSKLQIDRSDTYIVLAAGHDCPIDSDSGDQAAKDSLNSVDQSIADAKAGGSGDSDNPGPCIFPVIIAKKPRMCPLTGFIHWMCFSDRVLVSSGKESVCP